MTSTTTTRTPAGRLPWWVAAFVIPVGFVAAIQLSTLVGKVLGWRQYNYDTETAEMLVAAIPVGVLLLVVFLVLWRWSGWTLQGPKTRWNSAVWWTLVVYLGFGVLTFVTASRGSAVPNWSLLTGLLVAGLLVGVNEEIAFRGFGLNGLARKLPVFWAVLVGAVIFGLCHSTNVFSGSAPSKVALQVVLTTFGGLLFGWLYIFSGRNLWLVAIIHGIHDFLVVAPTTFAGASDDAASALDTVFTWAHSTVGGLVSGTVPLVLTYYGWQKYRGYTLEQALGLAPAPTAESEPTPAS